MLLQELHLLLILLFHGVEVALSLLQLIYQLLFEVDLCGGEGEQRRRNREWRRGEGEGDEEGEEGRMRRKGREEEVHDQKCT